MTSTPIFLTQELKLMHLRNVLSEGMQQVKKGEVVTFSLQDILHELDTQPTVKRNYIRVIDDL